MYQNNKFTVLRIQVNFTVSRQNKSIFIIPQASFVISKFYERYFYHKKIGLKIKILNTLNIRCIHFLTHVK